VYRDREQHPVVKDGIAMPVWPCLHLPVQPLRHDRMCSGQEASYRDNMYHNSLIHSYVNADISCDGTLRVVSAIEWLPSYGPMGDFEC
jgi:hypothetical protein